MSKHRHILECSGCGMSHHLSDKVCDFCGEKLRTDKVRHAIRYNIPFLSLFILLLLLLEFVVPFSALQKEVILLADEAILCVFLVDIVLDKNIYDRKFGLFFRRRALDFIFVLPLLKAFRVFEGIPALRRAFTGAHAIQHVPIEYSVYFSELKHVKHMHKYAKSAYPIVEKLRF